MGVRTARIPDNLEEYLDILISKGYATTYGNAINLIILERMMRDKTAGTVKPFKYRLKDARTNPTKDLKEIETENIDGRTLPLRDAPHTRGPDPHRYAGINPTSETAEESSAGDSPSYFGGTRGVRYPGTKEEYERDPKRSQFLPPE